MKRALALLAPAVLVVGLVACGDDDDTPDTTDATELTVTEATTATESTDEATDDTTEAAGSVTDASSDMLAQVFPDLDGDQLDCFAEQLGDVDVSEAASRAQEIADECGIDPADLTPDMSAISIPDLSGVSIPDNMDEMMQQVFPGLSDEQATCLVEQLGDDFDIAKAQQVAETCDIDPSDLTPG